MNGRSAPKLDLDARKRSWIDAGIPPAVTALLTVVGRIDGLIHAHTLLRALADIYAD